MQQQQQQQQEASDASTVPVTAATAATGSRFPDNTRFVAGDFLALPAEPDGSYDVVMCLSVTKWIHYHGGDAAIRTLFARVHALLRPGGLFILEPQLWPSYRKKCSLTPHIRATFKTITLHPEDFPAVLAELGFQLVEQHHVDKNTEGFNRPLFVYRKKEM
jgi:7SK snRNA methylphosphate capping enzyme